MNRNSLIVIGVVAFAVLVVLANTFYIVGQTEQAIVLRLGEPARVVNATTRNHAGLQFKVPFVEQVTKFDKRNLSLEPREEEIIASNQERLVVDSFLRYRISDPLQFYQSVRTRATAEDRLQRLINSALRQQLGSATTEEIISSRRAELMQRIRDDVARRAIASKFGIQVIDLRIKRADLPTANEAAVYERMKTQRQQEAAQIRATGEQQRLTIVATATKEAEEIKGQADAERARIFASSFGRDPSFAAFYRSMAAYEAAMGKDTTLVLSPDSEFFRYFSGGPGR
jgi:modulator of FtsH protease HflC